MLSSHLSYCLYYLITPPPWEKDLDFIIRIFTSLLSFLLVWVSSETLLIPNSQLI